MNITITIFLALILFNVIFYGVKCIKLLAKVKEDIIHLHRQLSDLQGDVSVIDSNGKFTNQQLDDLINGRTSLTINLEEKFNGIKITR